MCSFGTFVVFCLLWRPYHRDVAKYAEKFFKTSFFHRHADLFSRVTTFSTESSIRNKVLEVFVVHAEFLVI